MSPRPNQWITQLSSSPQLLTLPQGIDAIKLVVDPAGSSLTGIATTKGNQDGQTLRVQIEGGDLQLLNESDIHPASSFATPGGETFVVLNKQVIELLFDGDDQRWHVVG